MLDVKFILLGKRSNFLKNCCSFLPQSTVYYYIFLMLYDQVAKYATLYPLAGVWNKCLPTFACLRVKLQFVLSGAYKDVVVGMLAA